MKNKLLTVLATMVTAIAVPTALLAWGPSRTTFTTASPATYVTFNSITDNPAQGDERNFVKVREASAGNETYSDSISLTAGRDYVVFVYFHNNAASEYNLTATGSYVRAEIPTTVPNGSTGTKAVGYVGATNASPTQVWDDISFSNTTGGDIGLNYVPGSAIIHSFGAVNGQTMSDSIVTTGAAIGYNALDGNIPGCNEFAGYVTFRVRTTQPNFTISKQVHKTGTTGWKETDTVNPGDSVDYLITYQNTGTMIQEDVAIYDILPAGLDYVEGSTYLANNRNPNPIQSVDGITGNGINIGDYEPGQTAYIKFSAIAPTNSELVNCGNNTLVNTGRVVTANGIKTDTAEITVIKTCEVDPPVTPPELPTTGPGETIMSVLGLGTLITSIGYYIASRRALISR